MNATKSFGPEMLKAVEEWERLPHAQLSVIAQSLYALATHADAPRWIREAAEGVMSAVARKAGR